MRKFHTILLAILALLLAGCATQMEPPFDHPVYQKKPWKLRKLKLNNEVCWNINGVVSITSGGNTQMGSFSWKQFQDRYAISISGPLNIGAISIQGMPGRVTLNRPTGSYSAPNAETLMQQQLGWYLPVTNLYYWVRGLPAPQSKGRESYDNFGHLAVLEQEGWTIQYQAYQTGLNSDLQPRLSWITKNYM